MNVLKCELCGLEHLVGAAQCDGCDHVLGQKVDLAAMRSELRSITIRVASCVAAVVIMLASNLVLFGGEGLIILTAPIAIAIHSLWRWRALSVRLRLARGA